MSRASSFKIVLWFSLCQGSFCVAGTENQIKIEGFKLHQPIYFVGGEKDIKIQMSFKYQLANRFPIYFGYTQLMFWEVFESSLPFKEINFSPELFYRLFAHKNSGVGSLDVGILHTSNGKDGLSSRSVNRFLVRSDYDFQIYRHVMRLQASAYKFLVTEDRVGDLEDYLGFWSVQVFLSNLILHDEHKLDLEIGLIAGEIGSNHFKGRYQVGLIYHSGELNNDPSMYLQWSKGYAERLIDYSTKYNYLRLGVMLSF